MHVHIELNACMYVCMYLGKYHFMYVSLYVCTSINLSEILLDILIHPSAPIFSKNQIYQSHGEKNAKKPFKENVRDFSSVVL